ncbi:MAG: pilus assembly protein PilM [Candidatus Vogelbacteria bacterium]|nr:pilus assembly protein PilM [Candidatus Vogelbacteria bacterium]
MHSLFLRLFPVPRALSVPPCGIAISDDALTVGCFQAKSGIFVPRHFAYRDISRGMVVRGVVEDHPRVIDMLSHAKKAYEISEAFVSLPDEHAFFIKLQLSIGTRDAMRNSILFQLDEYVPLPPEQVLFDFEEVPGTRSGNTTIVVAVVYPKKMIDEYVELFMDAGIRPIGFEAKSQAIARALHLESVDFVSIVASVHRTRTSISFVNRGIVWFNVVVSFGGGIFEEVLRKSMQVDTDAAREALFAGGLLRTVENKKTFELLMPSVSALRDEIAKLHRFWHSHRSVGSYEAPDVSRLFLTGPYAAVPGLDEYISSGIGIAAEVASPWIRIPLPENTLPPVAAQGAPRYSGVIGLALRAL